MDMNATFKRNKKSEPNMERIFTLHCSVDKVIEDSPEENYHFKGKIKASEMDSDLMSTIIAKIITEATPKHKIPEVMSLTAEKLELTEVSPNEDSCCDCQEHDGITIHRCGKGGLINFLNKLLGE